MSKERLEEIRKTRYQIMELSETDMQTDFNFLLNYIDQQAELKEKILRQTGHNFEVNRKLGEQNKRYRKVITRLVNYIETTEDDLHRQLHKIHVVLDSALEGDPYD